MPFEIIEVNNNVTLRRRHQGVVVLSLAIYNPRTSIRRVLMGISDWVSDTLLLVQMVVISRCTDWFIKQFLESLRVVEYARLLLVLALLDLLDSCSGMCNRISLWGELMSHRLYKVLLLRDYVIVVGRVVSNVERLRLLMLWLLWVRW